GEDVHRHKIFICKPATAKEETPCATKILSTLGRMAYRKPLTDASLATLMDFYRKGRENNGNFESGIESALQFILASPEFLFRFEPDPVNVDPKTAYRLDDLALASRLSFFLWSSIPDDQLLTVASQGKLK